MKKRILVYSWLIFFVRFVVVELFDTGDIDSLVKIDVTVILARSLYIFFLAIAISVMVGNGIVELRKHVFKLN